MNHVLEEAAKAVKDREDSGTVKNSPLLWAAVDTLADFIQTQTNISEEKPDVPRDVLRAVMKLTLFLTKDGTQNNLKQEEELANMDAIKQFTKRRQKLVKGNQENKETTSSKPFFLPTRS